MEVKKETQACASGMPTQEQLMRINALAKSTLTEDAVYVFSLRLCDDQIDRDYECFDGEALDALAARFVGKTGVVDHRWSSDAQVARIFQTQVVQDGDVRYIKAWAYIRRGGAAEEIIADIEAGIKKEVSVGCAMGKSICSICGSDYGTCGHRKGTYYDGALCYAILRDVVDAYEFSFVAVPAQANAGVLKHFGAKRTLKALADEFGAQEEYRALCTMAELGREYEKNLQQEVVRLCLALELGIDEMVLRSVTQTAGADALRHMKATLSERLRESLPSVSQLESFCTKKEQVESGFLI